MTSLADLGLHTGPADEVFKKIAFDDAFWVNFMTEFDQVVSFYRDKSNMREIAKDVLVCMDSLVSEKASFVGPAIVMDGAEVRPNAFVRPYSMIGQFSVVGHATEISSSVLCDGVHASHKSYIGNSFVGRNSLVGAGAVLCNTRLDRRPIAFLDGVYAKMGSVIGENSSLGANCVINPGVILAPNAQVLPLGHR